MKLPRDRFLFSILVGIGVLIVLALILYFVRQGHPAYGDESTPAGVLKNYFIAVQQHDYERAYGYLATDAGKPGLAAFRQSFLGPQGQSIANTTIEIGDTALDSQSQSAVVQVNVISSSGDVFAGPYSRPDTATLVLQNGAWKISMVPYPYWPSDLPVAPPKPPPAPTSTP